ncbi:hypothetical protein PTTG_10034, partial [Puccinia triticina 1-1 BBBD Race 1]
MTATSLDQHLAVAYFQCGVSNFLLGMYEEAVKDFEDALMGAKAEGMIDLQETRKEKQTAEHAVIDDAIADRAEGYTVFSIPVGVLYRPASSKVKNLSSKKNLGHAKLFAATDALETFVGFTGLARAAAKTSTGPVGSMLMPGSPPGPSGIVRRGTTTARIEGTVSGRPAPSNDLRRRPSEKTASVNPTRLNRSATPSSGSRAGGGDWRRWL